MMEIKNFYLRIVVVILTVMCVGTYVNATPQDWKRYSTIDAFGEERPNHPVFITEVQGTINGEKGSIVFEVYAFPKTGYPNIRINLVKYGQHIEFLTINTVLVKLASGKVFEIPCGASNDDLYLTLGYTSQECLKILDILNKGNFTISVTSEYSAMEGYIKGIFKVGNQTTGITQLAAPIFRR
ncbi:MAG: hypothetical protein K2K81_05215 [Muribaculaceae bacterium]|nr:hypothetical protein [Muribaculaceae bacterium]